MHAQVRHSVRSTGAVKKRMAVSSALMVTSMMDILTVILFFLLQNYTSVVTTFSLGRDISLPQSIILQPPPSSSLQLIVTKNAIILDDVEMVKIVNGDVDSKEVYRDGVTIIKLAQAFQAHKKRSLYIEKHNDQHSFTGLVVLQADKALTFQVLKKVIYTAGITDFVNLKLAVLKKDA